MSLGLNYIKKELRWFLVLIFAMSLVEYVVLVELTLPPVAQFIIQMVIGLFLISAIIRLSYRIWLVKYYNQFIQNDDDSFSHESDCKTDNFI